MQCASSVLMVSPGHFGWNAGTAASNAFQQQGPTAGGASAAADVAAAASEETRQLARNLAAEGVRVVLLEQDPASHAPDAVFVNNWLSFHADGTLCTYPLQATSRREERDERIIAAACAQSGFAVRRRLDLSAAEADGRYLEGTGSLVLDHASRIAFAGLSPRTDEQLVRDWAGHMDYEPVAFRTADVDGRPYYHTNVLLWIGTRVAAVCSEGIVPADRPRVLARLLASGRDIVELGRAQVARFAGNMLELASWDEALGDCSLLVMSASARAALEAGQYRRISGGVDNVLVAPVPIIERVGGGSVRCMLAEIPAVSVP